MNTHEMLTDYDHGRQCFYCNKKINHEEPAYHIANDIINEWRCDECNNKIEFKDYRCALFLFKIIREFIKKTEGSYIPIHVQSGIGFMRALSEELSKYVELK